MHEGTEQKQNRNAVHDALAFNSKLQNYLRRCDDAAAAHLSGREHSDAVQEAAAAAAAAAAALPLRTTPRMIHAACARAAGGLLSSGSRNMSTRALGSSPPEPRRKAPRACDALQLPPLMEDIMP
jgi:hypothetical protein